MQRLLQLSLAFFGLLGCSTLWAQDFVYVSNDQVFIPAGDVVYVGGDDGGVTLENDGAFDNSGTLEMQGDFINNNPANTGFARPRPGVMQMTGPIQIIGGTQTTVFNNLELFGAVGLPKVMENDAFIDTLNYLDLNDNELRCQGNVMTILNTARLGALRRDDGFVSTTDQGRLSRFTSEPGPYLFPVGDIFQGPQRYRPVNVTPATANPHQYSVSFVNQDPGLPGFDGDMPRTNIEDTLCNISDFYHIVNRDQGTDPATIEVTFDSDDPLRDTVAFYNFQQVPTQWQIAGGQSFNRLAPGAPSTYTLTAWDDFSAPLPFIPNAVAVTLASEQPTSGFTVAPQPATSQTPVTFTTNAPRTQFQGPLLYNWDFGDGFFSTDASPSHVYAEPGEYTVRYTVTQPENPQACSQVTELTLRVEPRRTTYVPTAFTPNGPQDGGAGLNDDWIMYVYGLFDGECLIFNRWGTMIRRLEQNGNTVIWDGLTDDGGVSPEGVYVYKFNATGPEGPYEETGTITLLR